MALQGPDRVNIQNDPVPRSAGIATRLTVLACLVPLFVTPVLPLIDFYAHVARYYILGNIEADPSLAENYVPMWRLLPNLGLDVLGTMVMSVFPPLLGAKLLAALVILVPFFGALSLCRAVQGRTTLLNVALAGLLSFSFVLTWGFANFILGLGIGLWGLGLWISTAGRPRRQLAIAVAVGTMIMLIHGLAFGIWGLMLGCIEIMLIHAAKPSSVHGIIWRLTRLCIVAVLPVTIFLLSKTAEAEEGVTGAFTNLGGYIQNGGLWLRLVDEAWQRVDSFLRVAESSFPALDRVIGLLLWGALVAGFLSGALRLDRRLWLATALATALVFVMPPNLFGVGYLDDRMPLLLLSLLAAGTRVAPDTPEHSARWAATLSAALPVFMASLLAAHLGLVTVGWARDGQNYRYFLHTVKDIKPGGLARSVYFGDTNDRDIGRPCKPLLFLLLLQNGTAVPTFANPTQQPLGLTGPLKAALGSVGSIGRLPAEADRSKVLEDMATAGFETVVICDVNPPAVQQNTMHLVGQGQGWAVYQHTAVRATPVAD
jgi:hypothetical protein